VTAFLCARLFCDGCYTDFIAPSEFGWPPMGVLRKKAAREGWTRQPSSSGRRFDKDLCPKCKPGWIGLTGEDDAG
jgi:hypothetical protein